jgi:RNA polymerase sigma factor (sigma-70 family)
MTDTAKETELIRRAQKGDRVAFESLLRAHYDVMYRMAYKWCGNRADAEDITQNSCVKLARSIDSFRFESAFVSWLYRLVINTAKDWAKGRAGQSTELTAAHEPAEAPAGEVKVFASQVMAFIRRLPEKEREALCLVFSEGMSHREAAVVMACKESTVSWYIHEARKKLQSFQTSGRRHG